MHPGTPHWFWLGDAERLMLPVELELSSHFLTRLTLWQGLSNQFGIDSNLWENMWLIHNSD